MRIKKQHGNQDFRVLMANVNLQIQFIKNQIVNSKNSGHYSTCISRETFYSIITFKIYIVIY